MKASAGIGDESLRRHPRGMLAVVNIWLPLHCPLLVKSLIISVTLRCFLGYSYFTAYSMVTSSTPKALSVNTCFILDSIAMLTIKCLV